MGVTWSDFLVVIKIQLFSFINILQFNFISSTTEHTYLLAKMVVSFLFRNKIKCNDIIIHMKYIYIQICQQTYFAYKKDCFEPK
mmetsp:Transcript_32841/g.75573  ORF Transcript_32841/g.75573 Transcript_32841/m.75573 type:complete len:84 (+) Transcript_32841:149-400(+)